MNLSIWQLTRDDVEAVVSLLKRGKTMEQVAADLQISVEMVACAVRKWPQLRKRSSVWSL
jgi:uncharacterized protein (DUF433 family)